MKGCAYSGTSASSSRHARNYPFISIQPRWRCRCSANSRPCGMRLQSTCRRPGRERMLRVGYWSSIGIVQSFAMWSDKWMPRPAVGRTEIFLRRIGDAKPRCSEPTRPIAGWHHSGTGTTGTRQPLWFANFPAPPARVATTPPVPV